MRTRDFHKLWLAVASIAAVALLDPFHLFHPPYPQNLVSLQTNSIPCG